MLPGGWPTMLAVAGVVTLVPFTTFLVSRARGIYPGRLFRLTSFRFLWYSHFWLLLAMLAGVAGAAVGLLLVAVGGDSRVVGDAGRLTIAFASAVFVVAMIAGYWGSRQLVVTEMDVTHAAIPAELDGLRIVQVSDVHVGPHTRASWLKGIADAVMGADPHLIAITGDLVDDFDEDVVHYAKGLGALHAPLGVFVIAGNHDIYANWPKVRERLGALPVRVLVNEHVVVEHAGARFVVAGTGDPAAGRNAGTALGAVDIAATVRNLPSDLFTIALAHNPVLWPSLAERSLHLTLSGHTHWGQFAIPALEWCLASPFLEHAMGWHARGESLLYIHPGTTWWGIPFRLGTPPEVAVLTLRRVERGVAPGIGGRRSRQVAC
ncbi:MAG: metallophosphoesterase [Gemmatimonadetes bacterium]|nr:metallophosphoesterase [Gemmatimonadota bacterium]